jgi:uncharacterized membrane protein
MVFSRTDAMTTTRKHQLLLLAAMTLFCVALCITRIVITGEINYFFLNWNLFLAFVPLGVTVLFELLVKESSPLAKSKWIKMGVLSTWLLFFPNAPYILTDLFHMRHEDSAPQWFDLILILSYAWTGLMAGFISLFIIEKNVLTFRIPWLNVAAIVVLIFMTGFGIYLGRYLRFNSWDLWHRPGHLFAEIGDRFIHPLRHTRTWGMTIGMGALLNFIYWSIRAPFTRSNHTILTSD